MAITLMVALASAFVLSITFVPAMIALVITGKVSETEVKPIRWFKEKYAPLLAKAVARPLPFIAGGAAVFLAAVLLFGALGDDLDAMTEQGGRIAAVLRSIPGAADVQAEQTSGIM